MEPAELQNQDYSHIIESMDSEDQLNSDFTTEFDLAENDDAVDIFVTSPLHETKEPKQPKIIPSADPNIMIANDQYYKDKQKPRRILSIRKDKTKRTVTINTQESIKIPIWKELIPFETKNIPQEPIDKNLKDPRKTIETSQIIIPIEMDPIEKGLTITQGNQTTTEITSLEHNQNSNDIHQELEKKQKKNI